MPDQRERPNVSPDSRPRPIRQRSRCRQTTAPGRSRQPTQPAEEARVVRASDAAHRSGVRCGSGTDSGGTGGRLASRSAVLGEGRPACQRSRPARCPARTVRETTRPGSPHSTWKLARPTRRRPRERLPSMGRSHADPRRSWAIGAIHPATWSRTAWLARARPRGRRPRAARPRPRRARPANG